jgi:predicted ferric reductase
MNSPQTRSSTMKSLAKPFASIMLVGVIFSALLIAIMYGGTVVGGTFAQKVQSIFGMDSVQVWWYVTRASGLTGYFLLWFSMVWGFGIGSKIFQPVLEGTFTYDFHEHLSLIGLGFILLHMVVLMFDKYLPFNLIQILIPFTDSYRPFWVGLGIISFYIMLLVTVTFYLRQQIGSVAFRSIHILSLVSYVGSTLHGLFAGTDSALPVAMFLYVGTFLIFVFLTIYWLFVRTPIKSEKPAATLKGKPIKPYSPQKKSPIQNQRSQITQARQETLYQYKRQ